MTLPATFKVGAQTYRVKLSGAITEWGLTDHEAARVRIAARICEAQQRATLMHEVLHTLLFDAGAEKVLSLDADAEERLVSLLEPRLFAVLRDNPPLVTYLLAP